MKFLTIVCVLAVMGFVSPALAEAEKLKAGHKIEDVADAMKKAGYSETNLEMAGETKMWSVGDGVLIFKYAKGAVTNIAYYLSDNGPKSTRKEFYLAVKEFDAGTGEMVLAVKK